MGYGEFWKWLDEGRRNGWMGEPFCYVHDGPDLTVGEQEEVDRSDGDWDVVCFPAARLYDGPGSLPPDRIEILGGYVYPRSSAVPDPDN